MTGTAGRPFAAHCISSIRLGVKSLLVALAMCRVIGALGYIQRPFDPVLEQSMPEHSAAVVDQNQVVSYLAPAADRGQPSAGTIRVVSSAWRVRCCRSTAD